MNTPFELAFKYMPTPAFIIESSTGKLISYNRNFEILFENFNSTPSGTWESLCEDAVSPDDWQKLNKKIKSGSIERCESLIRVGDKLINMQLEMRHLGETVLACVYNTDHMDLSAAENTLLKFALTESSAGLWIWETESDLVSCSKSIATLLNYPLDKTPRSTTEWHALVHPDDVKKLATVVNEHVALNQDYYEVEYRILTGDQRYLWVKERGRSYTKGPDGSIKKIIGFMVDISHQKALEEHLRNQATFDELTGLLTRGAALTHFKKQLGLAKRQYTPLTMAKINLDANERLSKLPMEARNIAIQTSARYIYKKIREADVLARVEPDKLLLLLPNTSVKDAKTLLKHIINPTESESSALFEGNSDPMDFCIGIAAFPEDGETIEELALSANQAVEDGQASCKQIVVN
ncbi:MAG: PAS domain-containing protein [Gammaproteobacteria bacterium]|uniref:Diguanylate cyclase (GGDEF) domain-containing protein n=1 Tax=Marinomonas polaris DSM 16579 TaxID=1122206 RepID=A0A1M5KGU1_9GAMM|nr:MULTISPECIES: PAS domain-containing protein [Marinomonas]MBU1466192.1 PAS domain-containing protein [Gammaproteobacteria bacterium]MBU2025063.1 PAS domain-containing protein [Gammaproteobacteria bacterium]MBU2319849.1 PAS domain-containing protein [Gammaproteobacteria bacterium]MBU2414296.1 PAS domain-containing protein [Gammaproteobacteria bacterium]PJE54659.1 diguanylate cyclase [Marinomonas sp. BSi20584]